MKRLTFAPAARADLLAIARYIVEDNPERALSFVAAMEAKAHWGHPIGGLRSRYGQKRDCDPAGIVLRGCAHLSVLPEAEFLLPSPIAVRGVTLFPPRPTVE